jgi:hypothetical protein
MKSTRALFSLASSQPSRISYIPKLVTLIPSTIHPLNREILSYQATKDSHLRLLTARICHESKYATKVECTLQATHRYHSYQARMKTICKIKIFNVGSVAGDLQQLNDYLCFFIAYRSYPPRIHFSINYFFRAINKLSSEVSIIHSKYFHMEVLLLVPSLLVYPTSEFFLGTSLSRALSRFSSSL